MLSNMRISRKLATGFAAVVLVLLAMAGVIGITVNELAAASALNSASNEAQDALDQATTDVTQVGRDILAFGATSDARYEQDAVVTLKALTEHLNRTSKGLPSDRPDLMAKVAAAKDAARRWADTYVQSQLALMRVPGNRDKIEDNFRNGTLTAATLQTFRDAQAVVTAWSSDEDAKERAAISRLIMVLAAGTLIAVALSSAAAVVITRSITKPVDRMLAAMKILAAGNVSAPIPALDRNDEVGDIARAVQVFKDAAIEKLRVEQEAEAHRAATDAERAAAAEQQAIVVSELGSGLSRLSSGDLTCLLERPFAPEYDRLRTDFNAAIGQLLDVIGTIVGNSEAIRAGTGEIAQAADDLSRRTEQQAASLEETAAALDEITTTVKRTAEGAKQAQQTVTQAKKDAEASGSIVSNAVTAMSQIEASARQISQIIGVIDEIAFQTNLLALNAGVEAARAGDAGRGFAVVASEVRALAQRSAGAAKEIKALITASTEQVGEGVRLVSETGQSLTRIVGQVGEITTVIVEIAASAQEQASGLDEVNVAVNQMDQVTQQNAAMVEQSTAAGHALTGEVDELIRLTQRFQTGTAQRTASPPKAKPMAPRPSDRKPLASRARIQGNVVRMAAPAEQNWEEF